MTRYEQGFINKCAEYGVDGRTVLAKLAQAADASATPAAPVAPAGGGYILPHVKTPSAAQLVAGRASAASLPFLAAAGTGALAGALIDRKRRLRGALIGALAGIPALSAAAGYYGGKKLGPGVDRFINDAARQSRRIDLSSLTPAQYSTLQQNAINKRRGKGPIVPIN